MARRSVPATIIPKRLSVAPQHSSFATVHPTFLLNPEHAMTVSRREFLTGACAGGIAAGTAGLLAANGEAAQAAPDSQVSSGAAGSFSFVHLTDQHVTHRRHAPEGYEKCIAA